MKTRSNTFIYESEKEWQPCEPGVCRQILVYDGNPHAHYHTQTTYVAAGKFEFTIGDETKIVCAGDGLYMEPDIVHGCKCLEAGMLIDTFSPMRESFLQ